MTPPGVAPKQNRTKRAARQRGQLRTGPLDHRCCPLCLHLPYSSLQSSARLAHCPPLLQAPALPGSPTLLGTPREEQGGCWTPGFSPRAPAGPPTSRGGKRSLSVCTLGTSWRPEGTRDRQRGVASSSHSWGIVGTHPDWSDRLQERSGASGHVGHSGLWGTSDLVPPFLGHSLSPAPHPHTQDLELRVWVPHALCCPGVTMAWGQRGVSMPTPLHPSPLWVRACQV